jgi:activating signal cointegrator 1
MKAISLHQPWAIAVAIGLKKYETRSWSTRHRGSIAIHAAQAKTDAQRDVFEQWLRIRELRDAFEAAHRLDFEMMPFGKVIAIAEIDEVIPAESLRFDRNDPQQWLGDFSLGRYAWHFKSVRKLRKIYPVRGRQGLFNLPF